MIYRCSKLLLLLLLLCTSPLLAQDDTQAAAATDAASTEEAPSNIDGQLLFERHCTQCHKIGERLIGPNLAGITERRDMDWIIHFVQNSQEMIQAGDEYAVALFEEFNQVPMPPQPLNPSEVRAVIDYVEEASSDMQAETAAEELQEEGPATTGEAGGGVSGGLFGLGYGATIGLLAVILLILLGVTFALFKVRSRLVELVWEKEHPGEVRPVRESPVKRFALEFQERVNPTFAVLLVIGILVLSGAVFGYQQAQWFGSQIGYAPTQPIAFSHEVHAGQLDIDCQYCHSSVYKAKNAGIPSTNICMNCHNFVTEGTITGTEEIAKIRESYESGEPIEWLRIHNLPDLAYFNHAQHVTVGGVECQTCHGQVQEMEKVQQMSTLEMGWCINCHRTTNVNTDNPYYQATFDFIEEHEQFTVAQMGGTECARCHY